MRLHRSVRLEAADLAGASFEDVPVGPRADAFEDLSDVTFNEELHQLRPDGFVSEVADASCEGSRRRVESDRVTAVELVKERLLSFR